DTRHEYDGSCPGRARRRDSSEIPNGDNRRRATTPQFICQCQIRIVVAPWRPVVDRDVLSLDIAIVLETLSKGRQQLRVLNGRAIGYVAHNRVRWLLRKRGRWPRHRAAEARNKFAPSNHQQISAALIGESPHA